METTFYKVQLQDTNDFLTFWKLEYEQENKIVVLYFKSLEELEKYKGNNIII